MNEQASLGAPAMLIADRISHPPPSATRIQRFFFRAGRATLTAVK